MQRKFIFFLFVFFCHVFLTAPSLHSEQTIGIFTYPCSAVAPWDPDSVNSGITGSEEAVIYISKELSELGYSVTVLANPPKDSVHSSKRANPRYVPVNFDDGKTFDIAIAWRSPDAAGNLKKHAKSVYLWPHDTHHWHLSVEKINGFDGTLWLSKWQRKQWMSINPAFAKFNTIFGNGIVKQLCEPVKERKNCHSCIYGSNYARGLEILLDNWPEVKKQFPKATLDIYYGWQHWGLLSPEKEAKMRLQVAELASIGVKDHGLVGHEELNRAYETASLWTYPCTAPETFCITALRAQMAGAVPVIIEGSALTETVRHGYKCKKPEDYLATLIQAMNEAEDITLEKRREMQSFILQEYTWKAIAKKWKTLFDTNSVKPTNTKTLSKDKQHCPRIP